MLRYDPQFRRLKISSYGALGTASYWLGPDHLLVVTVSNYAERYQRFLYSDIQALIVRRTEGRLVWNVILGFATVLSLTVSLIEAANPSKANLTPGNWWAIGIFLGIAAVLGVLLAVNWLRGPTCICHLQSAVQVIPLPRLTRRTRAEQLLAELTPLLMKAQAGASSAADSVDPPTTDTQRAVASGEIPAQ